MTESEEVKKLIIGIVGDYCMTVIRKYGSAAVYLAYQGRDDSFKDPAAFIFTNQKTTEAVDLYFC